jgi:hypothetical protein
LGRAQPLLPPVRARFVWPLLRRPRRRAGRQHLARHLLRSCCPRGPTFEQVRHSARRSRRPCPSTAKASRLRFRRAGGPASRVTRRNPAEAVVETGSHRRASPVGSPSQRTGISTAAASGSPGCWACSSSKERGRVGRGPFSFPEGGLHETAAPLLVVLLAFPALERVVPPDAVLVGSMPVLAIPHERSDPGDRRPL